jgi:hypothetical protein
MRKVLFALAVAAIATTGLMADKCTYAPMVSSDKCSADNATDCSTTEGCTWDAVDNSCKAK